jgi:molybdopterin synthase sulfur carrier subunit
VTVRVRLFAQAKDAAGRAADEFDAVRLDELLAAARARYGVGFAAVLATARVWVNGDEPAAGEDTLLADGDEVAVLPPVSGGSLRGG